MLPKQGAENEGRRSSTLALGELEPSHGVPASSITGVVLSYAEINGDPDLQTMYERLLERHHAGLCAKEAAVAEGEIKLSDHGGKSRSSTGKGGGEREAEGKRSRASSAESKGVKAKSGVGKNGSSGANGKSTGGSDRAGKAPLEPAEQPLKCRPHPKAASDGSGFTETDPMASNNSSDNAPIFQSNLPVGWTLEVSAGKRRFTGPDGTQVNSIAKVMAWQRKQVQLEAHYASELRAKRRRSGASSPYLEPPSEVHLKPSASTSTSAVSGVPCASDPSPASSDNPAGANRTDVPACAPKRPSLPEYGLSLVEIEAAALPVKAGKGGSRKLPRELLSLAMPDRDWNVAMPYAELACSNYSKQSNHLFLHSPKS